MENKPKQDKQEEIKLTLQDNAYITNYDGAYDVYESNNIMKFKPNSRILDVGCGVRPLGTKLAKLGHSVVGIDISPNTKFKKGQEIPNFEPVIGDIENMPKRFENSFDYVFCGNVLHHFPIIDGVMVNMTRCLKKGGILIVVEPNGDNDRVVMNNWLNRLEDKSTPNEKMQSPYLYLYCMRMMGYDNIGAWVANHECYLEGIKNEACVNYIKSLPA